MLLESDLPCVSWRILNFGTFEGWRSFWMACVPMLERVVEMVFLGSSLFSKSASPWLSDIRSVVTSPVGECVRTCAAEQCVCGNIDTTRGCEESGCEESGCEESECEERGCEAENEHGHREGGWQQPRWDNSTSTLSPLKPCAALEGTNATKQAESTMPAPAFQSPH